MSEMETEIRAPNGGPQTNISTARLRRSVMNVRTSMAQDIRNSARKYGGAHSISASKEYRASTVNALL